eukprot:TRINITY_DN10364_c0_g1_i1.p1 TRINITY_DN10364_c0_g1~~TRINITY_DN10364_c0_g1_i1.p1  ORF type:complete len:179 (-),score=46.14 TRINITY_DN10364_c0_g1_i1:5-541(-)
MGNNVGVLDHRDVYKDAKERIGSGFLDDLNEQWEAIAGNEKQIDEEKFGELMAHLKQDQRKLESIFNMYDIDHNGYISKKEYICSVVLLMDGSLNEKISLVFNTFDENRNGVVSKKEFKRALMVITTMDMDQISEFSREVFEKCDTNADGKLQFDEFVEFVHSDEDGFKKLCGVLQVV